MKINGKRADQSQKAADERKDARKTKGSDEKRPFKELLGKDQKSSPEKIVKKDGEASTKESLAKARGEDSSPQKSESFGERIESRDDGTQNDPLKQREPAEFRRREPAQGLADSKSRKHADRELSPEDQKALMQGSVPGIEPQAEGDSPAVKAAKPLAPSQSKHELTEKLLATIFNDGWVNEDVKGRKVVMMQVDVPGRGSVNMRLWRKSTGVELRMRADDPGLASEIRRNRGKLESGARERGVHFSSIEVVG